MEQVQRLFGEVPMTKIGTFNFQGEGKVLDVYAARVSRGKTTDQSGAFMFVPHKVENPGIARIADVQWDTFMVRSYSSADAMYSAWRSVNVNGVLHTLKGISVAKPKWGRLQDTTLRAENITKDYTVYTSDQLDFKVTNFVESGSERGNDLEVKVELIPVLQSFNFAIKR